MRTHLYKHLISMSICCAGVFSHLTLGAQTIAEKKAGLGHSLMGDLSPELQHALEEINEKQTALQNELRKSYEKALLLYHTHAPESAYRELLLQINQYRDQIRVLEETWRRMVMQGQDEGYALWHQPNTTLEQLVIDYGSQEYVYLIPPRISEMTLSVTSNLPIPRASWDQMLDTILSQNGVGIKQLNPYLRQLYLLKEDRSNLQLITSDRKDLQAFPPYERAAFVLTPEPSDVKRIWFFLEKFVNPNSVVLQMIGRDILIIAQVSEIEELLKLYDFASSHRGDKEYKAVTLHRIDPEEMAKILSAMFGMFIEEPRSTNMPDLPLKNLPHGIPPPPPRMQMQQQQSQQRNGEENGLRVIPLPKVARAVFLVGTREEIRKAEQLICEVEEQIGESRSKVVYSYTARHSDPEALADVLNRIYLLLVETAASTEEELAEASEEPQLPPPFVDRKGLDLRSAVPLRRPYDEGFFLDNRFVINRPTPPPEEVVNNNRDNFIVDLKTGSIVMVLESHILPKMKEVIRQLDVPTKMVQLEVLLFEKKLRRENNFGLNLLKIGSIASHTDSTSATFNHITKFSPMPGIFQFLMSRDCHDGAPAFDLAYRFLLAQDDVHINACPSVLAVNQTPAVIEIAEEISVNTGIFEVASVGGVTLKDAFARAQYGILIEITPTIHILNEEDDVEPHPDYVSLITDVSFQTFRQALDSRPNVTTRHITNEVNIPDGQTVILGGLRQRQSHDHCEKIPFLGEIPGLGKLFSLNELRDETTEMFIFITPKIIYDASEDLERIRCMEMMRRPGDLPYFISELATAHEREKNRLFASSMAVLFGNQPDCFVCPMSEYDGR
jgi:general secretion pathway protein D